MRLIDYTEHIYIVVESRRNRISEIQLTGEMNDKARIMFQGKYTLYRKICVNKWEVGIIESMRPLETMSRNIW